METTERPISVGEAAEILDMSVRAVTKRIHNGTLPADKLPGKTGAYLLNRADVEALKEELAA